MALSKLQTANIVLEMLKANEIPIEDNEVTKLRTEGWAHICGFSCKIANVLSTNLYRVRVNRKWFKDDFSSRTKPRIKQAEFDYQLFPASNLYATYYLALRDYTLQLEVNRERWFKEPYWGMRINRRKGTFVWEGGNTKEFPLLVLSHPLDLELRAKQYEGQLGFYKNREDINESN